MLANAGASRICSDDVVRLFLDWIRQYSDIHFKVIRIVYRSPGSTRARIWDELDGEQVREDSAEADLFRLMIRELNIGGVIRIHRETTTSGDFHTRKPQRSNRPGLMKSSFDDREPWELTQLGEQFVHYTMNEIVPRIGAGVTSESSEVPQ